MKFNLNKALTIANAISNPKEAIGISLNMLSNKNPEMANNISKMIKAGEDPIKAIQKFATEGKFSEKELSQIKSIYNMAKKAGFKKFDVPTSVWKKAEEALKSSPQAQTNDWF